MRYITTVASTGIFFTILFLFSACGTIIQGTTQEVGISSSPSNATVTINGELKGKTPLITYLKRKDSHMVRIALDGYEPYETNFIRSTSGWIWGNLVFGGLAGLAVDAISGGMYKLSPEQINAELRDSARTASTDIEEDGLYIFVVLEPDEAWEKVGMLIHSE